MMTQVKDLSIHSQMSESGVGGKAVAALQTLLTAGQEVTVALAEAEAVLIEAYDGEIEWISDL